MVGTKARNNNRLAVTTCLFYRFKKIIQLKKNRMDKNNRDKAIDIACKIVDKMAVNLRNHSETDCMKITTMVAVSLIAYNAQCLTEEGVGKYLDVVLRDIKLNISI